MDKEKQVIDIPIDRYVKELDAKTSRQKKNDVIELLKNQNELVLGRELREIDYMLCDACKKGDLQLIQIYLSETIEDESNDLDFKINKTNKTASLFQINDLDINHITIPRTVQHESEEYLITSICWAVHKSLECSCIKTIKFDENSAVSTIYPFSISYSNVEEIYFPDSLKELKEGWCCHTDKLKKIIISSSNNQFLFKDDKYLIGKSDKNNIEFDNLLFINRDIEIFSIPTNIKTISSYSFSGSRIKEIFIPPNVLKISEGAFLNCKNLTKIEIPKNSNLQTIESQAFFDSNINKIFIPPSVSQIISTAFANCSNLRKVEIPANSNLQKIERDTFTFSTIKAIFIPPNVSEIDECAFHLCEFLQIIEIAEESKLKSFSSLLFVGNWKTKIMIPARIFNN